jgi:hypothetical protein
MPNRKCTGIINEILQPTEFVTIVTSGDDGPCLVGNWANHLRVFQCEEDTIILPAGLYLKTEKNLRNNNQIAMMAASRQIRPMVGGQGCVLYGRGEIVTSGPIAEKVKAKFPWSRGALLIYVEEAFT